ncbi:collagen alpha-1(II) chain-like [Gigantopelta aegis]|uniref:collagen alpha-1(II) chain-like n=1 Tax=Gigantopelta aegis TaxID=1735272 RepID=UPI001B889AA5|nr:collagen alpha-1(II) chain-like [Gigantopelta aegis]
MNERILQTLFLALVEALLVPSVTGDCLHSGSSYLNNTVWQPDSCSICTCEDPVVICENIQCIDPHCNFKQGEHLQIPAGGCCPVCVGQLSPCRFEGQSVSRVLFQKGSRY